MRLELSLLMRLISSKAIGYDKSEIFGRNRYRAAQRLEKAGLIKLHDRCVADRPGGFWFFDIELAEGYKKANYAQLERQYYKFTFGEEPKPLKLYR